MMVGAVGGVVSLDAASAGVTAPAVDAIVATAAAAMRMRRARGIVCSLEDRRDSCSRLVQCRRVPVFLPLFGIQQGEQAVVVFEAGRTALKVRAHERHLSVCRRPGQFEFDEGVEQVKALVAAKFWPGRTE